jgi:serine protease Do
MRWLWIIVAVIAVAGVADAGAKEKKREKRAKSGYIGVYMQDLTDSVREGLDLKVKTGVLVSGVEEDGPADAAGLDEGDVIIEFAGKSVASPDELRQAVRHTKPGEQVVIEVLQDGKKKTVELVVGERSGDQMSFMWRESAPRAHRAMAMFGGPRLGIQAHELDDQLGSYFDARQGVLVLGVDEESVAAKAGIEAGDVIQKIGDASIEEVSDIRESMHDLEAGDAFKITVLRHGKTRSLEATMDEQDNEFFAFSRPEMRRLHRQFRDPGIRMEFAPEHRQELRRELDELRDELRELKEKLDRAD